MSFLSVEADTVFHVHYDLRLRPPFSFRIFFQQKFGHEFIDDEEIC